MRKTDDKLLYLDDVQVGQSWRSSRNDESVGLEAMQFSILVMPSQHSQALR